jgi:hypothetical protein
VSRTGLKPDGAGIVDEVVLVASVEMMLRVYVLASDSSYASSAGYGLPEGSLLCGWLWCWRRTQSVWRVAYLVSVFVCVAVVYLVSKKVDVVL